MASEKKIRASSSGDSHAQAVDALLQIMWNTKTFTLVQFIFISSCYIPTAFQLFCNIFSARPVKYECSQWNETQILQRYSNDSSVNVTATACSAEITDGQTGIVLSRLDCTAWTYPEGRGISLVSDVSIYCLLFVYYLLFKALLYL
ncbi:uncharacterized protein LOC101852070 [Aplysia californica]|uniref:Uncharacterized protein LOC101852070 n=1 Tax=Aplysia californica TaxID=6500 RepID=A0ABM1A4Z9_APLCA|nr:uncharacterized protein LOC101852070 [Aplysia californica]